MKARKRTRVEVNAVHDFVEGEALTLRGGAGHEALLLSDAEALDMLEKLAAHLGYAVIRKSK